MSATEKAVEEIFSTFRDFLYRDLFYVVGGVSIIATTFFLLGKIGTLQTAEAKVTVFLVVISYVVGYATQEAMSIVGLVRTAYKRPGKLIRALGKRFAPDDPWDSLPAETDIDASALCICVDLHMSPDTRKRHQRTINLKQLCSSMGSAGTVSTFLLATHIVLRGFTVDTSTWWLFAGLVLGSATLVVMNNIKNVQQRLLELAVNDKCTQCGRARRT